MSNPVTFIDEALESVSSGEDFVQAMADIYSHDDVRAVLDQYNELEAKGERVKGNEVSTETEKDNSSNS